jgi:hypothetical protein
MTTSLGAANDNYVILPLGLGGRKGGVLGHGPVSELLVARRHVSALIEGGRALRDASGVHSDTSIALDMGERSSAIRGPTKEGVEMGFDDYPDLMTIPEAAGVARIARGTAYRLAKEFRDTGGRTGLPNVAVAHGVYRVPKVALTMWLSCEPPAAEDLIAVPESTGRARRRDLSA